MPGRFDSVSLFFFATAGLCCVILLLPLFLPITFIAVLWFFITITSVAIVGYMGNKVVRLFLGEKVVQAYYPHDHVTPMLQADDTISPKQTLRRYTDMLHNIPLDDSNSDAILN